MQYTPIFSAICLAALGISSVSCSSSDPTPAPGGGCTNFNYATYAPAAMPTFATAVMPILQNAQCALAAACHLKGANKPNLGGDTGATAATIAAAIVEIASEEVPTMKYVAKGAPENSYLMRKLESPNPGCGLACTSTVANGCSTQMPSGVPALSAADQGTIRDWIKQGAQ